MEMRERPETLNLLVLAKMFCLRRNRTPRLLTKFMATKTKNSNKSAARSQRTRDEQATNARRTRYLYAPIMQKFRGYLKKDVANAPQIWMPIECNLLFRYEFAACSLQTRYLFVAILLYCGARGTDEIPVDIRFLSNALNADARTIGKSLEELEIIGLLAERKKERGFEREDKKDTDRQKETDENGVSVDSENLFQNESENQSKNGLVKKDSNGHLSQFTIEECLRYVEKCQSKGDAIKNPKALATNLYQTGTADSFILSTLYPERAAEAEREVYGEPVQFTDEPCRVCFGAKMSDADGKGFRKCVHCQNERGKSTGFEPKGGNDDGQES